MVYRLSTISVYNQILYTVYYTYSPHLITHTSCNHSLQGVVYNPTISNTHGIQVILNTIQYYTYCPHLITYTSCNHSLQVVVYNPTYTLYTGCTQYYTILYNIIQSVF